MLNVNSGTVRVPLPEDAMMHLFVSSVFLLTSFLTFLVVKQLPPSSAFFVKFTKYIFMFAVVGENDLSRPEAVY